MLRLNNQVEDRWKRLEDLLGRLEELSVARLSRDEVREFGELYRRAATDLAIARAESRDPKVIDYLNGLVIRAHGKIYRAESSGGRLIADFFIREFPAAFRRQWRIIFFAFALFTAVSTVSFTLNFIDPAFTATLGLDQVEDNAASDQRWWLALNTANQIGSVSILTNNIFVALKAFAYGALLGIGTVWVLFYNGLMIGGVLGVCYRVNPGFGNELVTFMVGHGVIELSCIFIAGGAGMLIGYSVIDPGDVTRTEALKKNGLEAIRLAMGCAALLVLAGVIEGFLSPADIPWPMKYATGIASGIAMYAYLIFSGREARIRPDA